MEKEFFLNTSMQQFEHPFPWQNLTTTTMEIQPSTTDTFESALSSMVSSPQTSNSPLSNDNFMIRELIGKLGNICNSSGPHHPPPPYVGGGGGGNCSTNNSCYSTPISSPPKIMMQNPLMDFPKLGNSIGLNLVNPNLPAMPGDPGFAERAARFSSFGSRSFNGRTSQFRVNNNNNNNGEVGYGSNSNNNLGGNGKLQRVSSSPSLIAENKKNSLLLQNNERKQGGNCGQEQGELNMNNNSRENSSISGQVHGGENGSNRKRKAVTPKGKSKDTPSQSPLSSNTKVALNGEESSAKRSKTSSETKTGENREEDGKKQSDGNQKPPEPPKDYIHVRARRGQATDSHSLAERVRREKISERMKLLQDLVPGCDKVTGKALMLDEIINYVQSLQRQVEFLSMKLANVNPRLDFNMGNLFSKDVIQPNSALPHPMYPLDSLAQNLYGQPHQNPFQDSIPTTAPCPNMDPLNPTINQNHSFQLPTIDGYSNGLPQLPSLCEGDLQSIVQMGFVQKENGFQSQNLQGSNTSPLMKIEF